MDPLTHGLLGAAAAQAVFARKLPRSAWLVGAVAAMSPDLDVFIQSDTDPLLDLIYHRHFTHALAFIPVGGLLIGAIFAMLPFFRGDRRSVLGAATIAYATHSLLDACTSYGTLLFWPFSYQRIAWDFIAIIDPFFTGVLLVGVVVVLFLKRPAPARIALALAGFYMAFGALQHHRVMSVQRELAAARGQTIMRGRVLPTPLNLTLWRSIYLADDGRLYADGIRGSIVSPPTVRPGDSAPRATMEDLPPAVARESEVRRAFKIFRWFADGYLMRDPANPRFIGDMRYAMPPESMSPMWGLWLPGAGSRAHPHMGGAPRNRRDAVSRAWQAIWGRDPGYISVRSWVMTLPRKAGASQTR